MRGFNCFLNNITSSKMPRSYTTAGRKVAGYSWTLSTLQQEERWLFMDFIYVGIRSLNIWTHRPSTKDNGTISFSINSIRPTGIRTGSIQLIKKNGRHIIRQIIFQTRSASVCALPTSGVPQRCLQSSGNRQKKNHKCSVPVKGFVIIQASVRAKSMVFTYAVMD